MLTAILFCGCGHTAIVQCWAPAEINVDGMQQIVVADFVGDAGPAIAASLANELWENKFYTLVDASELDQGVQTAGHNQQSEFQSLLQAASAAGVDGVIFGEIVEYRCEDQILESTDLNVFDQNELSDFTDALSPLTIESRQTILREGTVTLAVRLVDAETGEVRASRKVTRGFQRHSEEGDLSLPTRGEVLNDLTDQCLTEIVSMLAPHQESCQMELASCDLWTGGYKSVRKGLRQARRSDWAGAEESWQLALEENPQNHAALYNLSIAAARREAYDVAEGFALEALKLEHKDCYTGGLQLIRERRRACERAEEQRDSRVVSSDYLLTQ